MNALQHKVLELLLGTNWTMLCVNLNYYQGQKRCPLPSGSPHELPLVPTGIQFTLEGTNGAGFSLLFACIIVNCGSLHGYHVLFHIQSVYSPCSIMTEATPSCVMKFRGMGMLGEHSTSRQGIWGCTLVTLTLGGEAGV